MRSFHQLKCKMGSFHQLKLGLQHVQELWLLWHMRFPTFKTRPCELASSTGECQVHCAIRDMYWEIFKRVYMGMESLQFSRLQVWKLLNGAKNMFKFVRVNLTTLMTLPFLSLSLFLSHEEVWSSVASAPVSKKPLIVRLYKNSA